MPHTKLLPPPTHRPSAVNWVTGAGLCFILLVIAITTTLVMFRYNAALTTSGHELRRLDLLLAEESDRSLQSVRLLVDDVVDKIKAKGVVSSESLAAKMGLQPIHEDLRSRLAGVPQLDALTIIDTRGFIVNFSRRWPVADNDLSDRDYFSAIRDGSPGMLYISKPLIDRATNLPTVYLGRRISGPQGDFVGIVLAAVTLGHFDRFYASLDLAPGDSIALWREDGTLLTQFPEVSHIRPNPLSAFRPPFERWRGLDGVFEDEVKLSDGMIETKIAASAKTAQFSIYVTIAREKWAVLSDWRREAVGLICAGLVMTAAVGILLWEGLRHLTTLEQAAQLSRDREQAVLARREIEDVLRQSQKMEIVGQLTGGIAHDFNNVLTVVTSVLCLIRRKLEKGETDVSVLIARAFEATSRAEGLTRRLLALSRHKPDEAVEVYPDDLLRDLGGLIVHALEDGIVFDLRMDDDLWSIKVDPGQLENVVLNLAVNARDAMPEGGTLTIAAGKLVVTGCSALPLGVVEGEYVVITVSDTGSGMSAEVVSRIFEAFYTTKDIGKGTGLGLSQVMSFAVKSGGYVKVCSEVGIGTTFQLYLPRFGDCAIERVDHPPEGSHRSLSALEVLAAR